MLRKFSFIIGVLSLTSYFTLAQETEWDIADRNIVRLSPDSFPQLPKIVSSYLKFEGYTIPQSYLITVKPHNVISGHFKNGSQTDWAVLASKDRVSSILIFWNGMLDTISSIGIAPDKDYLQGIGGKAIAFSRSIELIGRKAVLDYVGGTDNVTLINEHDGINDLFLDKASAIHYLSSGKWYKFYGVD